jgi:signal transduction histidine kinase
MTSTLPECIEERVQHILPPDLLHDLRTPLGHILGYSELIIEQMQERGDNEFVPQLEKIRDAGHKLLAMMKDNFQGPG